MRTPRVPVVAMLLVAVGCTRTDPAATTSVGGESGPPSPTPVVAVPLRVVAVAVGGFTSYALMNDGSVRAWGDGGYGALGDSALELATTPVVVPGIVGATAIAAGGKGRTTACAIVAGGEVRCWGSTETFPVRPGDGATGLPPTDIPVLAGAAQISLGDGHGCAILGDGKLTCWGHELDLPRRAAPVHREPAVIAGLSDVVKVRVGPTHACALTRDGSVACWGDNETWQAGPRLSMAVTVAAPTVVEGLGKVTDVAVMRAVSCALQVGGEARCWGKGRLFKRDEMAPLVPLDVPATALSTGWSERFLCLIAEDGRPRCLGTDPGNREENIVSTVAAEGAPSVTMLAASDSHVCAATVDGGVWCWGDDRYGGLGRGAIVAGDSYTPPFAAPAAVRHVTDEVLPAPVSPITPSAAAQSFAEVPAGCVHGPLELVHPRTSQTQFVTRTAVARISDDGEWLSVDLRDYADDPGGLKPTFVESPRGKQLALKLDFKRLAISYRRVRDEFFPDQVEQSRVEKRRKVEPGVHRTFAGWLRIEPSPKIEPTVEVSLRNDRDPLLIDTERTEIVSTQQVDLTHVGPDWVCGRIDLASREARLFGRFAARVRL